MGNFISDTLGGIGDFIGDNAGAIIGGIAGFYMGPAAWGWSAAGGAAAGAAAGDYVQHGDVGHAAMAGVGGYAVGSMFTPTAAVGSSTTQAATQAEQAQHAQAAAHQGAAPSKLINAGTGVDSLSMAPGGEYIVPNTVSNTTAGLQGIGDPALLASKGINTANTANAANTAKTVNTVGQAASNKVAETSMLDKAMNWVGDNKLAAGVGALTLLGTGEDQGPESPDIKNEYDEYRKCVASGRTDCDIPAGLYPTGRQNLGLGRSNTPIQVDRSLITPAPQQGARPMYGLMNELQHRSV